MPFPARVITKLLVIMLFLIQPVVAYAQTETDSPHMKISKGISMHGVLNWPKMAKNTAVPEYEWPPFADKDHALKVEDLQTLKSAGFDTIRLTVGLGIFLSAQGPRSYQLEAVLRNRVKTIIDSGLNVIVDFHPVKQDPRYQPIVFTRGPGADFVERFRTILTRTAALLSAFPKDKVALEILNEPATESYSKAESELWQKTQKSYYDSVRKVAPDLTLVLTGCCDSNGLELTRLDPSVYKDKNIYYTFHFYAPHAFTHQGTGDRKEPLAPFHFVSGIRFPVNKDHLPEIREQALAMFEEKSVGVSAIEKLKAERRLQTFIDRLAQYGSAGEIEAGIQKTLDWAKAHGIEANQLFIGEFGVMRQVDEQSRKSWLQAVVNAAEKRGIAWSYWSFEQPEYMGIINSRTDHSLDPVTLEGLGLKNEEGGISY